MHDATVAENPPR